MHLSQLLLIAIGLSMDAFAVAVCTGLSMPRVTVKKALIVGLYFGAFQALMPFMGYTLATQFAGRIIVFGHWVAFIFLSIIGGRMIAGSLKKETCEDSDPKSNSLRPGSMLPLAFATSIDALAVGISFAFLAVEIIPAVSYIGLITLMLCMAGVKIGNAFGMKFRSKAEFAGGVILVLIGVRILLEHFGIIG